MGARPRVNVPILIISICEGEREGISVHFPLVADVRTREFNDLFKYPSARTAHTERESERASRALDSHQREIASVNIQQQYKQGCEEKISD